MRLNPDVEGFGKGWIPEGGGWGVLGTNDQFGTELESFRALSDLYSSSQTQVPYVGVVGVTWRVLRDGEGGSEGGFSGSEAGSSSLF